MNRPSTTNGQSATSALAQGGYDAYFAQAERNAEESTEAPPPAGGQSDGGSTASDPVRERIQSGSVGTRPPTETGGLPSDSMPPAPPAPPGQVSAAPGAVAADPEYTSAGRTAETSAVSPTDRGARAAAGQSAMGGSPTRAQQPVEAGEYWDGAPSAASRPGAASTTARTEQSDRSYSPHTTRSGAPPDISRVPDRITRTDFDAHRSAVLPPALASPDLLADIAAVRQAHLRSTSGVRGALNKVGFKFGLSPTEQAAEERRTRIRRHLISPYQIAVVSVKGGVGRTTTAAALGSTFASLRPDRVAAVDANPDFGDLSTRTARHPYGLTLRDLAGARHPLDSFSSVHAYMTVNAADLAVIASPWNTDASEALSGDEYAVGTQILQKHFNLMLVDCGTGLLDSVTATVLETCDAVLVVTPATVGGVTGAVATLNWLSSHGYDHLIARSVIAIVAHTPNRPTVDVSAIERLFAGAQRPTCQIPFDEHLAEGGEVDLRLLDKETVLAFEELAAGLADDFPRYDIGTMEPGGRL